MKEAPRGVSQYVQKYPELFNIKPVAPTAGPAEPVKVAEPAAPEAPAEVTAGPTEPAKVEEAPAPESPVPTGFKYTLLESPAYEGLEPLSLEDE
jgi:hypothetical protein